MAAMELRDQAERSVEVNRMRLIEILQSNKEKHIAEYEEAKAGYRTAVMQKIEESFASARKAIEKEYQDAKRHMESLTDEEISKQNDHLTLVSAAPSP